jgi:hypothetical protein
MKTGLGDAHRGREACESAADNDHATLGRGCHGSGFLKFVPSVAREADY